ncbi:aldehyde dehydrogenase family protein [Couchioplanes caeruleus]|uniref:aldehyde dehydrogenase family protein n=1 Tax=Couchioplanes caeruleus TaxID=56438 RepID=UPI001B80AAFC|nr:aldehyde dehydrogenase family protein [Couchioplanes caeruleus]
MTQLTTSMSATMEIRNPATGEPIGEVPVADPARVAEVIAAAQQGRREMAALPAHQRAALLARIADGVAARFRCVGAAAGIGERKTDHTNPGRARCRYPDLPRLR